MRLSARERCHPDVYLTVRSGRPVDGRDAWAGLLRNAYADNYLIDVKFGAIMDVEASRAIRQA
jgi:hypothetical protein